MPLQSGLDVCLYHGYKLGMLKLLFLISTIMGCSPISWRMVDVASLALSEASLACDMGQTMSAANTGWSTTLERNPVMGLSPSRTMVGTYFAAAMVLNAVLWAVLPRGWRSAAPVGVVAEQVKAIRGNLGTTPGPWCGAHRPSAM
ncbi:MAG TPA: hypothetical protein VLN57_21275 [Xanthobacteraceae bacterium]|nr:hypothetical protein [Xanthobacteraceae bacterium]